MTKAAELAKMGEVLTNGQIGGRRNIIINGAMQVAQRATSVTGLGAASGYFTLDRFTMVEGDASAGRFTMSQSAVTDLDGFSNALKIDCTTADTSIAAGEVLIIRQHIEGLNCQQLKASSTSTNAFTLSFYAKSNASRVIASELRLSSGTNRQAVKVHTIGTSWARYTFTVAAASSTEIDNDNTTGLQANFFIHGGSTFTGGTVSATLESDTPANRAAGIGSIFASTDNTLEITGVQLEVGSQATPFEHRSFGEELRLCQRYFNIEKDGTGGTFKRYAHGGAHTTTQGSCTVPLSTPLRDVPSIVLSGNVNTFLAHSAGGTDALTSLIIATDSDGGTFNNQIEITPVVSSGLVAGEAVAIISNNSTSTSIAFDAEL